MIIAVFEVLDEGAGGVGSPLPGPLSAKTGAASKANVPKRTRSRSVFFIGEAFLFSARPMHAA